MYKLAEKLERMFDMVGSDKAFYMGLKWFGIAFMAMGFINPGLWVLSSGCFAGMLFMGKPETED